MPGAPLPAPSSCLLLRVYQGSACRSLLCQRVRFLIGRLKPQETFGTEIFPRNRRGFLLNPPGHKLFAIKDQMDLIAGGSDFESPAPALLHFFLELRIRPHGKSDIPHTS